MTYADIAEEIFFSGMRESRLLEIAKYRPGKKWSDVHRALEEGKQRGAGRDFFGNIGAIANSLEAVIVLK